MLHRAPRRGERGLTTLEWLLIVAAVAGLAALAVVLVQNVVDDTAEEISGNNARITAAKVAAARINNDAIDEIVDGAKYKSNIVDNVDTLKAIDAEFEAKCNRLTITYSDAGVKVEKWNTFPFEDATSVSLRSALEGAANVGCEAKGPDEQLTRP